MTFSRVSVAAYTTEPDHFLCMLNITETCDFVLCRHKFKLVSCVTFAAERKTRSPFLETLERRQAEENAIVHALFSYFGKKLLGKDKDLFSRGVDEVFAHSVLMSVSTEGDSKLVEEVKDHLQTNGLQVKQELVSKVITSIVFFFLIFEDGVEGQSR